jgi:hypothetical protein
MRPIISEEIKTNITNFIAGYLNLYHPMAEDITDEIVHFLEHDTFDSHLE